jgi:hypothetical protein
VSVARTREINARLRAHGITVLEWAGWESRGNGQTSAYEGGLVHHTATSYGFAPSVLVNGRTDLTGPLCNYSGNEDGSVTVIAAHPANHAGASGGYSMGPLPVTSTFNRRVMGLEIVYPGTAPMRPAQYHTANVWARIVADVCGGGNIQSIRAHAETSVTGKWDPGYAEGHTIDMNAFRAASINPEDDMPLTDDDVNRIATAVGNEIKDKVLNGADDVRTLFSGPDKSGDQLVVRTFRQGIQQALNWTGAALNAAQSADSYARAAANRPAGTPTDEQVTDLATKLRAGLGEELSQVLGHKLISPTQ